MKGIALIAALLVSPGTAADDFYTGLVAYNTGDYRLAVAYWQPLAEGNHAKAQSGLAYLYFRGRGVVRDSAEAARWYRKAADQGAPDAQLFLAIMHYFGHGVPEDHERALMWSELSLGGGQVAALDWRERIAQSMTWAERQSAGRLALAWRRTHGED